MKKEKGFNLIELVVFIVVMAIIGRLILLAFVNVLQRSPLLQRKITANHIAVQCMEWFVGQRYMSGFSNLTCPSPGVNNTSVPTFCSDNLPSGYTLHTTLQCNTTIPGFTGDNYANVTVQVGGFGNVTLSSVIANY
jgi:type II secretory pathway pseudopilin PulG